MISVTDALKIHQLLILNFGGSSGVRDMAGLEAAINRPLATFDSKELYPQPAEKAVAIIESIIINHPFVDGNKRTAYVLMRLLLLENGFDFSASSNEKYEFIINIASGNYKTEEIKKWITNHIIKIR